MPAQMLGPVPATFGPRSSAPCPDHSTTAGEPVGDNRKHSGGISRDKAYA